ncbi:outer membrane protein [Psychromonas sp. KJ10-10]|uniref:outer membrane protein n=1 Tax=Psychromonas sp. KJ10-10 TaxID=3391823 RepID=UPI0039B3B91F
MNATEKQTSLKVLLGTKSLDSNWGVDDSMATIGFLYTYQPTSMPIGLAVDLYGSGNENKSSGMKTDTTIGEVNLGLRWQPQIMGPLFQPYVGAGISFAKTKLQQDDFNVKQTYEDNGTGYWLGGGVDYLFTQHWLVGVNAHYSSVDLKVNKQERDAGGLGLGLTVGYRF